MNGSPYAKGTHQTKNTMTYMKGASPLPKDLPGEVKEIKAGRKRIKDLKKKHKEQRKEMRQGQREARKEQRGQNKISRTETRQERKTKKTDTAKLFKGGEETKVTGVTKHPGGGTTTTTKGHYTTSKARRLLTGKKYTGSGYTKSETTDAQGKPKYAKSGTFREMPKRKRKILKVKKAVKDVKKIVKGLSSRLKNKRGKRGLRAKR